MSSEHAIVVVLVLLPLQVLTYNALDRRVHAIAEVISSGISRGASIPVWHRRGLLQLAWLSSVAAQLFFQGMAAIAWLLAGQTTSADEFRLLAYLMAFVSFLGVLGWMVSMPYWYLRLSAVLRQAEAD